MGVRKELGGHGQGFRPSPPVPAVISFRFYVAALHMFPPANGFSGARAGRWIRIHPNLADSTRAMVTSYIFICIADQVVPGFH